MDLITNHGIIHYPTVSFCAKISIFAQKTCNCEYAQMAQILGHRLMWSIFDTLDSDLSTGLSYTAILRLGPDKVNEPLFEPLHGTRKIWSYPNFTSIKVIAFLVVSRSSRSQ